MTNMKKTSVLVAGLVTLACGLQIRADRSDRSLSLLHPKNAETIRCQLHPDNTYRFSVSGISKGISKYETVLLWVQPVNPQSETPGWYLQRGFNGIRKFEPTGEFQGIGEIGNRQFPPRAGDTMNVAVMVLDIRVAERLLSERGVVTCVNLPGEVTDVAWKVRVGM